MSIEFNLIPEGFEPLEKLLTYNGFSIVKKIGSEIFAVHKNYLDQYRI
jgi:hypothetical protein